MTPRRVSIGMTLVLLASVAARAANSQAPTTAPQAPALTDEELAKVGEDLVNRVCDTSCHGLEKLDEMRRTPLEWDVEVATMKTKGALATDPEFSTIKKYLPRYYGVVPVNRATAQELSAVLGLTPKDAEAIVAYRTEHGKFTDLESFLKVPGIDKARIEEQPDALRFN